jgi:hypothetical protein
MPEQPEKFDHFTDAEDTAASVGFVIGLVGGTAVWMSEATTSNATELVGTVFAPALVGALAFAAVSSRIRHFRYKSHQKTLRHLSLKKELETEMLESRFELPAHTISRSEQ